MSEVTQWRSLAACAMMEPGHRTMNKLGEALDDACDRIRSLEARIGVLEDEVKHATLQQPMPVVCGPVFQVEEAQGESTSRSVDRGRSVKRQASPKPLRVCIVDSTPRVTPAWMSEYADPRPEPTTGVAEGGPGEVS